MGKYENEREKLWSFLYYLDDLGIRIERVCKEVANGRKLVDSNVRFMYVVFFSFVFYGWRFMFP